MKNISQDEFKKLAEDKSYTIIDVRTPKEWAEGIIPNAHTLDIKNQGKFIEEIQNYDKNGKYLMVCRSGGRSGNACSYMDSIGFAETFNLMGGMMAWTGEKVAPE